MRIRFLGTRGEIDRRSHAHARHSSLLVSHGNAAIVVDWGADWWGSPMPRRAHALLLTHAHVDHVGGLGPRVTCPVYATVETWERIRSRPVEIRRTILPGVSIPICGMVVRAVAVEHSLRAPTVGYRITAGGSSIFYVPDVLAIPDRDAALAGIVLYIGDGATITRAIVRRRDGARVGHAPIRDQLQWCAAEAVPRAVFTHCGSQIVRADTRSVEKEIAALGAAVGVRAGIAHDGTRLSI